VEAHVELGFETIGNATLICHDREPVLVTDPWIEGSAYFGSWKLSHRIPEAQFDAIKRIKYAWFSHGHPDHLKVFANEDAAEKWFEENDPEGVAFEYDVLE